MPVDTVRGVEIESALEMAPLLTGILLEASPGIEEIVIFGRSDVSTETSTLIFLLDLDEVTLEEDKLLVRSLFVSEILAASAMKEPKTFVNSN